MQYSAINHLAYHNIINLTHTSSLLERTFNSLPCPLVWFFVDKMLCKFLTNFNNCSIQFQFYDLANIARAVSRSYCGSEISETDIYSPYSFYGSEAGTDVATSDLHDGWNASQV